MHPDGRLQRLRIAIAHPGEVRAGWSVIAELARRAGTRPRRADAAPMAFAQLVAAVPFYARDHARGDRRRAACAGPSARRGGCATPRRRPAPRPRRGRRPAAAAAGAAAERRAAARDLPPDLGRARGRDLAGAPVHDRPASRSSSRPRTRARLGHRRRRRRSTVAQNGTRLRGDAPRPLRRPAGHRVPRRRDRRPTRPTRSPSRSIEVVQAVTIAFARRQLLRAVVGPDRQGARDLRA